MCIIIAKKTGIKLDYEELERAVKTASLHNCHGTGFSLKKKGSSNIILSKGYMYYSSMLERVREIGVEDGDELMIHMRHATSGEVNVANCHPYVVSDKIDEILTDEAIITDKAVVSHNGTFHWYADKKSEYSDTVLYIQKYLSGKGILESMRLIENVDYYQMFQMMQGNRLGIMHPEVDKEMDTFGYWNQVKDNSLEYSNYYHIQPFEGYKLLKENAQV